MPENQRVEDAGVRAVDAYRCLACGEHFLTFRDGESHYVLNGPDHKYEPAKLYPASLLLSLAEECEDEANQAKALARIVGDKAESDTHYGRESGLRDAVALIRSRIEGEG